LSLIERTIRRSAGKVVGQGQLLKVTVIKPGGVFSAPKVLRNNGWWPEGLSQTPFGKLRFFTGQPDATDASKFTIDYHDAMARGTLDASLQADDTVQISVRDVLKLK